MEALSWPNWQSVHTSSSSSGSGDAKERGAGLNVAEKAATSRDLLSQMKTLVRKVEALKDFEKNEEWKVITVAVGHNDLCKFSCSADNNETKDISPEEYAENVIEALDYLSREMKRTFVNLLPPADPTFVLAASHKPLACHLASRVFCPCIDGPKKLNHDQMSEKTRLFRDALNKAVSDGRYDNYDDFAVVTQPALEELIIPSTGEALGREWPDLSYMAPNCLYPSQKLHALSK